MKSVASEVVLPARSVSTGDGHGNTDFQLANLIASMFFLRSSCASVIVIGSRLAFLRARADFEPPYKKLTVFSCSLQINAALCVSFHISSIDLRISSTLKQRHQNEELE